MIRNKNIHPQINTNTLKRGAGALAVTAFLGSGYLAGTQDVHPKEASTTNAHEKVVKDLDHKWSGLASKVEAFAASNHQNDNAHFKVSIRKDETRLPSGTSAEETVINDVIAPVGSTQPERQYTIRVTRPVSEQGTVAAGSSIDMSYGGTAPGSGSLYGFRLNKDEGGDWHVTKSSDGDSGINTSLLMYTSQEHPASPDSYRAYGDNTSLSDSLINQAANAIDDALHDKIMPLDHPATMSVPMQDAETDSATHAA